MKSLVKIFACVLFTTVVSFGLFTNNAFALGDFSQSCIDSYLDGSVLSSVCRTINGSYNETSIDLNSVIENVDGNLTWQPANFIETCSNVNLEYGSYMTAECKTRAQYWVYTEINLDDHIANIDGTLLYE